TPIGSFRVQPFAEISGRDLFGRAIAELSNQGRHAQFIIMKTLLIGSRPDECIFGQFAEADWFSTQVLRHLYTLTGIGSALFHQFDSGSARTDLFTPAVPLRIEVLNPPLVRSRNLFIYTTDPIYVSHVFLSFVILAFGIPASSRVVLPALLPY